MHLRLILALGQLFNLVSQPVAEVGLQAFTAMLGEQYSNGNLEGQAAQFCQMLGG